MGLGGSKLKVPGANGVEPVPAVPPTVNAPANNGNNAPLANSNSNKYRAINNANQAEKNAQRNRNIIPVNKANNKTNVILTKEGNNSNNNTNVALANSGKSVTGSAEGGAPKSFNLSSMGSGTASTRRRSLKNRKQRGGAKAKTPKAKKTKGKKTMRK